MDLARNLIGRINVGDRLTRTAASRPDQLAVVDGDRRLSYAEFNGYVNRLAHGLAGLGYEREAVILVDQLPKTSTGKIQKNVVRSEHSKYFEEG